MTTTFPEFMSFLGRKPASLLNGPIAALFVEDDCLITESVQHHLRLGFRNILLLSPEPVALPEDLSDKVSNLHWHTRRPAAHVEAINALIRAVPEGTWLYYCFNAEFLYFPFSETRQIGEMLAFHVEERRSAMLTYVVDLYAADLKQHPNAASLDNAYFDHTGYYALARTAPDNSSKERQLDFFGGLRWRFEEYMPRESRRIDRISLFRAQRGLRVAPDHRFNIEEYNTYACPWHNNLTAAIASFRAAKALMKNPGSRDDIRSFIWSNSRPFEWRAQQLMDLGLMESGQWF